MTKNLFAVSDKKQARATTYSPAGVAIVEGRDDDLSGTGRSDQQIPAAPVRALSD
jgi:hypothetical protein